MFVRVVSGRGGVVAVIQLHQHVVNNVYSVCSVTMSISTLQYPATQGHLVLAFVVSAGTDP